MAELRGLCKKEAEEQWGVARRVCAQCFEFGKFVIAKVEVGDRWKVVAGIEVAGKGLAKEFLTKLGFCHAGAEWFTALALSFSFLSSSRMASNLFLSGQ
jgi:hypothetical protein